MGEGQLEKLYHRISTMIRCEPQNKKYKDTKELCETLEQEMTNLMSPELKTMFQDYKEYISNLGAMEKADAYIDGLSFGIRVTSEAFVRGNEK